jgi:hypothetical protein
MMPRAQRVQSDSRCLWGSGNVFLGFALTLLMGAHEGNGRTLGGTLVTLATPDDHANNANVNSNSTVLLRQPLSLKRGTINRVQPAETATPNEYDAGDVELAVWGKDSVEYPSHANTSNFTYWYAGELLISSPSTCHPHAFGGRYCSTCTPCTS